MKTNWLLLGIILFLVGCEKKADSIGRTIVKGRAWDDNRQQPIKNLLVYIYDVKCENWACHYNQVVDSTRTDDEGYYEMDYRPKNQNSLYVTCDFLSRLYVHAQPQNQQQRISKGNNTANFTLRQTSVLKTRVTVSNNPFPPLKIFDNIEAFVVEINGENNDTIVYLRGVPNQINPIDLVIVEPGHQYGRRKTEIIFINSFDDTLNVTITADVNTFDRFKYY